MTMHKHPPGELHGASASTGLDNDHGSLAAAGVDPLETSLDRERLMVFVAQHPELDGAKRALRRLAAFFARRGKGPLAATPDNLGAFWAELARDRGPGTVTRLRRPISAFYGEAFAEESVSMAVAIAGGADALAVSPDREQLLAFIARHDYDQGCARVMRDLAGFFGARGKGPRAATADELDTFRAESPAGLSKRARDKRRAWLKALYEALSADVEVSVAVAFAAGANPLEVSPDREILQGFVAQHRPSRLCAAALRQLAAFFARRNRGPCDATPLDLHTFESVDLRWLAGDTRGEYLRWIRAFYRVAFAQERVSVAMAAWAGMNPLEVSPDRDRLAAFLDECRNERVTRTALRRLARYYALRDRGPLCASAADAKAFQVEALGDIGQGMRERYRSAIREFYRSAFDGRWPSPQFAIAIGVHPLDAVAEGDRLRGFADRHSADEACAAALRQLALWLVRNDKRPSQVTPDDFDTFYARSLQPLTAKARGAYRRWIGAYFADEWRAGRISIAVAAAAGADPVQISPDREAIAAFIARRSRPRSCKPALKLLCAFFARRGRGPLQATVEELEAFDLELQHGRYITTVRDYRGAIGSFYTEALRRRQVTLEVAIAARADALETSPDKDALRAFRAEHPGNANVTIALRQLAGFFILHDKGPLAATPDELAACYAVARRHLSPERQVALHFWVRDFYAEQFRQRRVARPIAITAGVFGPARLDET